MVWGAFRVQRDVARALFFLSGKILFAKEADRKPRLVRLAGSKLPSTLMAWGLATVSPFTNGEPIISIKVKQMMVAKGIPNCCERSGFLMRKVPCG